MSKRRTWVEHFNLLDVDMYWFDIVVEHAGSTAFDTLTFAPTRATGGFYLPVMIWPIV